MSRAFPFGAVVGQETARLALVLAAVDPGIGGVLLRGEKGTAKSTLARGLAAVLPGGAPFIELPIGATEDRVSGGLDLGAAMAGRAELRPGLLAAADGGVLYVDEVNLLPDHLVDLLLDAAASGTAQTERDGLSQASAARFVLVGSMNPEEGELRPQLLDRFGLAVEIKAPTGAAERAAAVRARLGFDRGQGSAHPDRAWADRLAHARPAELPDEVVDFACRLALAAGVEGLRGDLVLCRAGAALAGWEGRDLTTPSDIERVAPLALAHRRRRRPFDPPTFPPEELQRALDQARADQPPGRNEDYPNQDHNNDDNNQDDPDPAHTGASTGGVADRAEQSNSDRQDGAWGDLVEGDPSRSSLPLLPPGKATVTGPTVRGRMIRDQAPGTGGPVAIAPVASLRTSLQRQAREDAGPNRLTAADLREAVRVRPSRQCTILVVDTSGSMGAAERVRAATGAVLGLLADAYRSRSRVALITCRGTEAQVVLSPTASVELARAHLEALPTGGATPLAEALELAGRLAEQVRRELDEPLVVVVSDGRATAGAGALERALASARTLRQAAIRTLVLDAEGSSRPLGLAARVAAEAGGECVRLDDMTPVAVEAAVRQARG
ncbi:MAG: VWA domain-containing protein [Acidimicrobiales bacterium]